MSRQVAVALYHREAESEGRKREINGHMAFHWAILVTPEVSKEGNDSSVFEASDANELDRTTFRLTNPNGDWFFKSRDRIDPFKSSKLLGYIIIGAEPSGASFTDLKEFFGQVPLPVRNRHPQESCVTWVENAVEAIQKRGWAPSFDVKTFMDYGLQYADGKRAGRGPPGESIRYPES